jgi:hypothetical protein
MRTRGFGFLFAVIELPKKSKFVGRDSGAIRVDWTMILRTSDPPCKKLKREWNPGIPASVLRVLSSDFVKADLNP